MITENTEKRLRYQNETEEERHQRKRIERLEKARVARQELKERRERNLTERLAGLHKYDITKYATEQYYIPTRIRAIAP
ncbi:unnamed protein product, partial [Oikopleura dioica]